MVRGKAVFERKRCVTCHAEPRPVAKKSAMAMLAAVWKHSPAVVQQGKEKGAAWPKFEGGEMADLLAYLSSLGR